MNTFCIALDDNSRSTLIIHPDLARVLGIDSLRRGIVRFGCRRSFAEIILTDTGIRSQIYLSKNIIEDLLLPIFAHFEIRIGNNEIVLGPFLGILRSRKNFTKSMLNSRIYNMFAGEYIKLAGVLVVFCLDGVDRTNQTVQGYCFDPRTSEWKSGIFPYPAAIYRRCELNTEWKNHFLSVLGDTIFNNYYFDKWEMYCWLSLNPQLAGHLPATELYLDQDQIQRLLKKYGGLYLKPVSGMKGIGVIQARLHASDVFFRWRENSGNRTIVLPLNSNWHQKGLKIFPVRKYILQEPINLLSCQDCLIDFRVILQKDQTRQWLNQGIIARLGAPRSIVSNISSGGTAFMALKFLQEFLGYNKAASSSCLEHMNGLALNTARSLDSVGINCGILGIDIGLDQSEQLRIIEVNNRDPDSTIALDAGDHQLYHRLCVTPLYYAKALGGFMGGYF